MSEEAPKDPRGGPRFKTREDDARGATPGRGVVAPGHGGMIGNPPFVATDEQREKVRSLAQIFGASGHKHIAIQIGISVSTLRRHFEYELELGEAEMLTRVGAQMIARALDADSPNAKGDPDLQKFVMSRRGGYTTKQEVQVAPPPRVVDLDDVDADDLREVLPALRVIAERLRAQKAEEHGGVRRLN